MTRQCTTAVLILSTADDALSQSFVSSIMKTTNADAVNAPKMEGQEIIAHSLPSDNNVDNDTTQGLEDMAGLPFGNDAPEDEDRSSNQTWGLFNKRNMMILLCIAVIVFLCVVTGISSAALTNNNNSVVVESFNGAAAAGAAKSPKAPTAKAGKAPDCIPNIKGGNPTDDCNNCCGVCAGPEETPSCFKDLETKVLECLCIGKKQ